MLNNRGNRYSRNHTYWDPQRDAVKFWNFSWHENGLYDLPVTIDYILESTNRTKLLYVGNSMGCTEFFVLTSLLPEYQQKISYMVGLNPSTYAHSINLIQPIIRMGLWGIKLMENVLGEIMPHSEFYVKHCFSFDLMLRICKESLYLLLGRHEKMIEEVRFFKICRIFFFKFFIFLFQSQLPVIFGHVPSGSSFKQTLHYIQGFKRQRFAQFDYGKLENLRRYGSEQPPDYSLKSIKTPISLYHSPNDNLVSSADIKFLRSQIVNLISYNEVPYKPWNHVSNLWNVNARKFIHVDLVRLMKKYENL